MLRSYWDWTLKERMLNGLVNNSKEEPALSYKSKFPGTEPALWMRIRRTRDAFHAYGRVYSPGKGSVFDNAP